jgi:hypothetical protein
LQNCFCHALQGGDEKKVKKSSTKKEERVFTPVKHQKTK